MEDFLIYLIKSAGLLCLFLLFYIFMLKKDTTFSGNRKFLLGGLLLSAALPAIYFTRTVVVEAAAIPVFYTEGELHTPEILPQASAVSPAQVLFIIYFIGVIIMAGRFILQFISLGRIFLSGDILASGRSTVIHTKKKIAPFSFLNYIIYNPQLHSENELRHILKHEKVHVQQWHSADVLLGNLNLIYQWFNPFAWLYLKNIQQNLEFIADSEAVKEVSCKKEYQKALVRIAVENSNLALTNNFYQSLIKKRIMMLNRSSTGKETTWKIVLILPILLAFLLLFNVKTVAQVKENGQNQQASATGQVEVSINITKNTSREQLDRYKELLQKYNVQLDFEEVEYNSEGKLASIKANFLDRNHNNSGSISRSAKDGIESFMFFYHDEEGSGFRNPTSSSNKVTVYTTKASDSTGNGEQVLFVLNETKASAIALDSLDPVNIDSITVIKGQGASTIYGNAAGKNVIVVHTDSDSLKRTSYKTASHVSSPTGLKGKVITIASARNEENDTIYTRAYSFSTDGADINASQFSTRTSPKHEFYFRKGQEDVLYVIDGKEMDKDFEMNSLDQTNIASINVLKGDAAITKYGQKGENGVIEITTSKTAVKPVFTKISSSTTEEGLKIVQQQLKEQANLMVTFEDIYRNKKGLITRIKVSGKKGNSQATATYDVEKGIPDVFVGVSGNSVIISSDPPKK